MGNKTSYRFLCAVFYLLHILGKIGKRKAISKCLTQFKAVTVMMAVVINHVTVGETVTKDKPPSPTAVRLDKPDRC